MIIFPTLAVGLEVVTDDGLPSYVLLWVKSANMADWGCRRLNRTVPLKDFTHTLSTYSVHTLRDEFPDYKHIDWAEYLRRLVDVNGPVRVVVRQLDNSESFTYMRRLAEAAISK